MPATQSLTAVAVSDASGNITFPAFAQAPIGSVVQGTVSIPGAPLAAQFTAQVNQLTWGTFAGFNPWGPVQLAHGQALTITGTGLTATTAYTAIWLVGQFPESQAPSPPIPYGSITQIANTTTNPVIVQFPTPPSNVVKLALQKVMNGSAQQLANSAMNIGVALLSDPNNAHPIYISDSTVSTNSAYISPGQGVVLPVANANAIYALGTARDVLSYWGA